MDKKKIWEVVYLYEVENANPNGDPMLDNRPRYDDELEVALVSDVRIKRWIRDYLLYKYKNKEKKIYVREEKDENGNLLTREEIIKLDLNLKGEEFEAMKKTKDVKEEDLKIKKEILRRMLDNYLDIRLFGATLPIEGFSTRSLIGPVQFRIGKTLNKTEVLQFQGTTVLPSGEDKGQGTMTEWWGIRYGLFAVYGVVNFNNKDTKLKEEDVVDMLEAIAKMFEVPTATTRSKIGHRLVGIVLVKGDEYIGNLDDFVKLKLNGKEITFNVDEEGIGKGLSGRENLTLDFSELKRNVEEKKGDLKVWIPNKKFNIEGVDGKSIVEDLSSLIK